jgi:4-amino-4-deoxy-L-arabinose transferase-like glycosyltransferase
LSFATRIYLLALIARLIPVLLSIELPIGLDDMFQYDMLARSISSGEGFRWYGQEDLDLIRSYIDLEFVVGDYNPKGLVSTFRAPLYPGFLALIYSISGLARRLFAARLAQAFLGASLAPLTLVLGNQLFPQSKRVGEIGAIATAFYPMLVIYPLALATENLFIPLVLVALLLTLKANETGRGRDFLFAGAAFALATLTRSVVFLSVGLIIVWLFFVMKQRRAALLFGFSVVILLTPWVVRNSLVHEQFTFIESSLGYNLHMGYHPEGTGTFQYGISLELLPYLDDAERNSRGIEAGLGFIREDPGRIPSLMLNKLGYFFSLERRALSYFYSNGFFGQIPQTPLIGIFLLFALPFVLIANLSGFAGVLMCWDRKRALLALVIAGYLIPHLLLIADARFHLAILPMLSVLAGYGWVERKSLWLKAQDKKGQLALILVLIGLLWLNWGVELWLDADKLALLFGPDGYRAGFSY